MGFFKSKRLRQDDPISSFVFILVIDILSRLLPKAEGDEDIKGIQVATGCPRFSRLVFVDDLIIFVKRKRRGYICYNALLWSIPSMIRLSVNKAKSSILFNYTGTSTKNVFISMSSLNILQWGSSNASCLGISLILGTSKRSTFQDLISKMIPELMVGEQKSLQHYQLIPCLPYIFQNPLVY